MSGGYIAGGVGSGSGMQSAFQKVISAGNAITAFADAGGGQVTVTSTGHGLYAGDSVTISGTTSYNGTFTIANVTDDDFEITDTWVADDATGVWANSASSGTILAAEHALTNIANVVLWETVGADEVKIDMTTGYPINKANNDIDWSTGGYTITAGRIEIIGE